MTLLVPQNGEGDMLSFLLNKSTPQDLVLRLYSNNRTPAAADVAADYTEATFTGYAGITLTGASWTVTEGNPGLGSYAQQTFTSTAAQATQQIYGYFLTRASSSRIAWAEKFADGPYPIANLNDQIKVLPKLTLT